MNLLLLSLLLSQNFSVTGPGLYPTPELTPGKVLTTNSKVVCKDGYTKTVRNVTEKEKQAVFARYGIKGNFSNYEVDHYISLELGGSNDIENLWPQAYSGVPYTAREKDVVETDLHRRVCKGEITLPDAVATLINDWIAEYTRIKTRAKLHRVRPH